MIFVFQIQQHCHHHQHIPLKIYIKKMIHLKIHVKKFSSYKNLFFSELRWLVGRLKWTTVWNLVKWKLWDRKGKVNVKGDVHFGIPEKWETNGFGGRNIENVHGLDWIEWINKLHINLLWKIVNWIGWRLISTKKKSNILNFFSVPRGIGWLGHMALY